MKQHIAILALTSLAMALAGCGKSAQGQIAEEQLKAIQQQKEIKEKSDAEAKAHHEKMYRVPPPSDRKDNKGF